MTRECGWCKKPMEEICPECGGRAIDAGWLMRGLWRLLFRVRLDQPRGMVWMCINWREKPSCSTILFAKGLGQKTHGICEACAARERSEAAKGMWA